MCVCVSPCVCVCACVFSKGAALLNPNLEGVPRHVHARTLRVWSLYGLLKGSGFRFFGVVGSSVYGFGGLGQSLGLGIWGLGIGAFRASIPDFYD